MAQYFKELDYQKTPLGDLVLRCRRSPSVPDELVYEVTINHEMLMSSSVDTSERELARLALEGKKDRPLDVLIGGLGLGCTAAAALDYANVRRLVVIELLEPVIAWHRNRLVPMADKLMDDPRCTLVEGDFFEHVGPDSDHRYDAILLDIDHTPECWLHDRHRGFYTSTGLGALARCLRPAGIFAIWSAGRPAAEFMDALAAVFPSVHEQEIAFFNPHLNENYSDWVITAV
ncbi:MAG: spermidine synthase [Phycisphaerae bacterium]|nr:spermidine synthase [Phycisphaerae bacterium]